MYQIGNKQDWIKLIYRVTKKEKEKEKKENLSTAEFTYVALSLFFARAELKYRSRKLTHLARPLGAGLVEQQID